MNEQQFALQLRKTLDASVEHLPYRVTHRLEVAREAALTRMTGPRSGHEVTPPAAVVGASAPSGPGPTAIARPFWWRAMVAGLPVVFVGFGLVAISIWQEFDAADETAAVDLALLTDDLPISAYADRGFGVYIRNSHR